MPDSKVTLGPEDPTVFAKCPKCSTSGLGSKVGPIFGKAYTARRWKREPVCENCNGPLVKLFEVGNDE